LTGKHEDGQRRIREIEFAVFFMYFWFHVFLLKGLQTNKH